MTQLQDTTNWCKTICKWPGTLFRCHNLGLGRGQVLLLSHNGRQISLYSSHRNLWLQLTTTFIFNFGDPWIVYAEGQENIDMYWSKSELFELWIDRFHWPRQWNCWGGGLTTKSSPPTASTRWPGRRCWGPWEVHPTTIWPTGWIWRVLGS